MIASGEAGPLTEAQLIGDFHAKYFTLTNVTSLILQLFVVSRVVSRFGVRWAVMILPALSFGVYNTLAFVPVLTAVLVAKAAENATDYSLNNTVRNMLFLPLSYEQKFSAKQTIDSFFVRMGEVLSAAFVFVGTTVLALQPRGFAFINASFVVALLVLAWRVAPREGQVDLVAAMVTVIPKLEWLVAFRGARYQAGKRDHRRTRCVWPSAGRELRSQSATSAHMRSSTIRSMMPPRTARGFTANRNPAYDI